MTKDRVDDRFGPFVRVRNRQIKVTGVSYVSAVDQRRAQALDDVVSEVSRILERAETKDRDARSLRVEAGRLLLLLRQRVEAGEAGADVRWWRWYSRSFVRSRRDAERLMRMAGAPNPAQAAATERAEARTRMARRRAKNRDERSSQQSEDDGTNLVDRAIGLVAKMKPEERALFDLKLRALDHGEELAPAAAVH